MTLKVSEIFYSLQGEGARAGEPSVFVRLSGCSAKHACATAGIICDTEFESGMEMSLDEIQDWMNTHAFHCNWIIWTGGEPLDQLTPSVLGYFAGKEYRQALETSGVKPLSSDVATFLSWIVCSPKVAEHILAKHFPLRADGTHVDELRYVRHLGQGIPAPQLKAKRQYLSPHAEGTHVRPEVLQHCIDLCLKFPNWSLSVQQHKLWRVL
jgi:7-carboxy-7-deazaguanine synthase